jgi:uncharacterized Zn finger protein (UPF0148 family)
MVPDDFSMNVSIPLDDDGYLDRECPHAACVASFKILADDWTEKVRDEEVFCPVCGHRGTSDQWLTQEQVKHLESSLLSEVMPMIDEDLKRMTRNASRGMPRGGLISLSMSYKPSHPVTIVPLSAAELMQQRYTCESCACRYAAIGAAFFCPSCGHNSARTAFAETIATIRKCPEVRKALEAGLDRDAAANAYRLILEENMGKLVASFQRFAEAMFEAMPNAEQFKPRRNLFQNLNESSDFWENMIGKRYEAMVGAHEWGALQRYFQQRHVLAHKDGLVDDEYVKKTGDQQYRPGQRLVLKERDVLQFAQLVEGLAAGLQSAGNSVIDAPEEEG